MPKGVATWELQSGPFFNPFPSRPRQAWDVTEEALPSDSFLPNGLQWLFVIIIREVHPLEMGWESLPSPSCSIYMRGFKSVSGHTPWVVSPVFWGMDCCLKSLHSVSPMISIKNRCFHCTDRIVLFSNYSGIQLLMSYSIWGDLLMSCFLIYKTKYMMVPISYHCCYD